VQAGEIVHRRADFDYRLQKYKSTDNVELNLFKKAAFLRTPPLAIGARRHQPRTLKNVNATATLSITAPL
jgi:hypothetical protein